MGKFSSFNSRILKILNKDRKSQDDSDLNDNAGTEDNASNPATSSTRFIRKPDPIDPKLGNSRLIDGMVKKFKENLVFWVMLQNVKQEKKRLVKRP